MTEQAPVSEEFESWDFAGFDGLAIARLLFGEEVSHLTVYQSLETSWRDSNCSLLRLGETNFRVSIHKPRDAFVEALQAASAGRQVWVKPSLLSALFVSDESLNFLSEVSTVKLPHRLIGLPLNRAVPARIADNAVLLWRHSQNGVPVIEIQVSPGHREAVQLILKNFSQ